VCTKEVNKTAELITTYLIMDFLLARSNALSMYLTT
jgi:hypothetical protein